MKTRILFISVLTCSLLNACGVYRNYQRPQTLPADSLYRDIPVTGDTTSIASLSWRELFTDPQLVTWIEMGIERNADLGTARLKVEEAAATLRASQLAFLPSLSLDPQGQISSFDGGKASKTYSLGGSAEWEADIFGALRNAKKQDRAALEASEAYRQAVQSQLVATIAGTYYSLLMLDEQLAITRTAARSWRETVQTMRALQRAGEQNSAAVAQAEASRLSAESSVLALERQIHELENSFSTLLGIVPQSIGRGRLADAEFPEELAVGVPLQLLSKRPDVRQAELQLAQAFYATNAARSAFYPKITLSGAAGWTNSSGAAIVDPGKLLLSAVGSLVQPIFSRGKNRANLRIAQAQQEQALLAFRQQLLDAGAEVNNALVQWQTARRTLALDREQVGQLASAVRSTRLLMRHGNTNYLEVLTAQQTLLQAQLTEVADRYDEIQGVIDLYHALGGGAD